MGNLLIPKEIQESEASRHDFGHKRSAVQLCKSILWHSTDRNREIIHGKSLLEPMKFNESQEGMHKHGKFSPPYESWGCKW